MLRSAETIMARVKDEDILTIHTIYGGVVRGHWYEDHILKQLSEGSAFEQIGELEYQRIDIY